DLAASNQRLNEEIGERIIAEDTATRNGMLFRAVFEAARDSIFVKDRSLKYRLINPHMKRLHGILSSSVRELSDEKLYGEQAAAHFKEVESRVLGGQTVEEQHKRPVRGHTMTFLDIRSPMRDSKGKIIGICGISKDISGLSSTLPASPRGRFQYPSGAMHACLDSARLAARSDSIVLLTGESGAGKDFIAGYLHDSSKRAGGPFFYLNCAAIAPELAEAELFGYETGAFTGARGSRKGLLELAEGGTLLLNEVGELPMPMQAKLLTFLDTMSFNRVGGRKTIKVNARLVAATNRDLEKEVADGKFRGDLFYRINVLSIKVPPLRERREDIPILVEEILTQLKNDLQLSTIPEVERESMESLILYHWPGNVRELKNVLERGLILSESETLKVDIEPIGRFDETQWHWTVGFPPAQPLPEVVEELRRSLVNKALDKSGGNKIQAARLLGISRYTLRRQIKGLGMEAPK
ncbi:sigma-54 interaction domain-containing protein, partial [Thermodesulfobacteriota bacterium]